MTIQERRVDLAKAYQRLHRREKDTLARQRVEREMRSDLDRRIDRDLPDPPTGLLAHEAAPVLGDWLEERGFARPPDDTDDGLWTNDNLIGTWP